MSKYSNFSQGKSFITFNDIKDSLYYLQKYSIPGFSLNAPTQATPYTSIQIPGNIITYQDFNCTFLLDEELNVLKEIYDWININLTGNKTSDFCLHIYNNTTKRIVKEIQFYGGWVSQAQDIAIDFSQNDTEPLKLDLLIKFANYEIRNINDNV